MTRRLGVLGTLVRDTIHPPGRRRTEADAHPVEAWGGIAYSLSAFEAAPPPGWGVVPMVKVGRDLRDEADRFLEGLEGVASLEGVRTVPEPNNRVELIYLSEGRRVERLTGGVPGWEWKELEPLARSCDALYVNFIAGWEMGLASARRLRATVSGPLYCDVHSLLLGQEEDGTRIPRAPERWREWPACFDLLQMNEDELRVIAEEEGGDPWSVAGGLVKGPPHALFVTLGAEGVAWLAGRDFEEPAGGAAGPRGARGEGIPDHERRAAPDPWEPDVPDQLRRGRIRPPVLARDPDPTGCGDVWGMVCFTGLLRGDPLGESMDRATRLAARNAALRGADDLASRLTVPRDPEKVRGPEEKPRPGESP